LCRQAAAAATDAAEHRAISISEGDSTKQALNHRVISVTRACSVRLD